MSPAVFSHGDLRLYLLALLAESPQHGYGIIQALTDRTGQGTLDVAITVLISIVLGALILAGLYLIVDDTVLPTITQRIKDMFNYGG